MIVHLGLCLLVVVNLLFVHVTGVVGVAWVLAFAALALLAPLMRRFTDCVAYRVLWSTAVLALFVALVNRTLVQGVGRMLEGGLILAVFCQVHLVNNIGARQRPDLLLFNSFLIALITAFFCQEFVYSVVFVAYAFTLLTVWRMLSHRESGGSTPFGTVLAEGARHASIVLALTVAAFLLWPRDFEREGFVGERFLQKVQSVGPSDEIRLANKLSPLQSDRVVMRIRGQGEIPTHWRGSTFALLEAGAWHATTMTQEIVRFDQSTRIRSLDAPWHEEARGSWRRAGAASGASLQIELFDVERGRLYLPDDAVRLTLRDDAIEIPHIPLADATFAVFAAETGESWQRLAYDVECSETVHRPSSWTPARMQAWLGLDPQAVPPEALDLALRYRRDLPARADAATVAETLCQRLRSSFAYGLPGQAQSATNLHEFFRLRRGHCEFFASALAIMLRTQRIPCRLVGGFLASEREADGTVVVRARHAHAWVEAFDAQRGWFALDPTPAQEAAAAPDSWLGALFAEAEAVWTAVTGFDERRRKEAIAWLADLPARASAFIAAHPSVALALLLAGAWLWRRWRRRANTAVAEYRSTLRRLRLRLAPGETPRQLLARARNDGLPASALDRLRAATDRHERQRYRSPPPSRGAGAVSPAH
ncbi:MAG: transglutaminaseTgpA domain-containing protein [Planctomycetota bacterium]